METGGKGGVLEMRGKGDVEMRGREMWRWGGEGRSGDEGKGGDVEMRGREVWLE